MNINKLRRLVVQSYKQPHCNKVVIDIDGIVKIDQEAFDILKLLNNIGKELGIELRFINVSKIVSTLFRPINDLGERELDLNVEIELLSLQ